MKSLVLVFSVLVMLGCTSKNSQEVNLAIWGNYITPETQARFTKETGIKLNISNFSSNEELLAKIQSGASGIDVAVPSDYMVEIMVKEGILEPLDASKIEHFSELDPSIKLNSELSGFAVPYAWTTSGLAYHKDLLPNGIKSWKELFENPALAGKISLMDDVREVLGIALKAQGYSMNTTSDAELAAAEKMLVGLKAKVKMFTSDPIDALLNKEVAVAHIYSSDALQAAQKSGGKIQYLIPAEGGSKATDTLVIIKGSKNKEQAVKLINFLINPEANVEFVKMVMAGPVLTSTKAKLPADLQNLAGLFPSPEVLSKLELIQDLGDKTAAYDKAWTKIKSE